jgi:(E)-4-hydroxy-3-methylbut-2-enyl-diphosphate synthase
MNIQRRRAKVVSIGKVKIGGNYPIAIQSMAKTKTADYKATLDSIRQLEISGCEIVRLAVKDKDDIKALHKIKQKTKIPLVADIHFNWRLALEAIDSGIDKIRVNPGNIPQGKNLKEIIRALKLAKIPLRIGVNSGSLENKYSKVSIADGLVKSTQGYLRFIEKQGFYDIVISLKAANVLDTIEAYKKIAVSCEYPLHLGLTATGVKTRGIVKSSVALGGLLLDGIGDTIRVSLTEEPQEEVGIAKYILEALDLRKFGPQIISCPTCGRCEVNLIELVNKFEKKLSRIGPDKLKNLKIAIMGCEVNGPGEAKEADIGIAFGKEKGMLFKDGKAIKKVFWKNCIKEIFEQIK